MKKVLITGASGFIGGFLVEESLRRGYETWAGIRQGSSRAHLRDERIHFIELKYDNLAALTAQLSAFSAEHGAFDYVIHNAGLTKAVGRKDFSRVNAAYTRHLVRGLDFAKCLSGTFLLMSSLASYGKGDEEGFRPICRDDEQLPDTDYGLSKLEAERFLSTQTCFPYLILHPTGVYGPGDRDYLMAIKSIRWGFDLSAGRKPQRITFIYVKDLARVAFLALENEAARNRRYLVADGDVYTDKAFSRTIGDVLGKRFLMHIRIPLWLMYIACLCSEWIGRLAGKAMTLNGDKYAILKQRNWICDITPLKEELGFTPAYTLRQGLEESIAWYRAKGWL
ncbi:MAG: SDR family NAD(P)-dependent oxidoreductase [Tannerellaceae bacterium]|jgi:nucleoside-diphosphate-sugar epimerase|nr:SDR family NAD(P)-dependent oxidoreductase [Tannerellaceae bacterium]